MAEETLLDRSLEFDSNEGNRALEEGIKSPSVLQFDDILKSIGEFGLKQRIVYVLTCTFVLIPSGIQLAGTVFVTGTPKFQCVTVGVECDVNKCCSNCTKYHFFDFTSAVSEYQLICHRASLAANVQAVFGAGMLVGSFVFGVISDSFGRRFCMLLCSLLTATFSLGASFAHSLILFTILRFATAASLTGLFVVHYVYILELVGPSYRTMSGKCSGFFWVVGSSTAVLLAYYIRNWRTLLLVASCPPACLVFIYGMLPKSARWLVVQGHLGEAYIVLMKFAQGSSNPVTSDFLRTSLASCRQNLANAQAMEMKHSPLDLLRTPRMRTRALILWFNWVVASLVFYGFLWYLSDMEGDPYFNLFIMFVVSELPGIVVAWIAVQKFGRRIPCCLFMITGGVACLFVLAISKGETQTVRLLAFIGRAFVTMSFSVLYLFSNELYATSIRNLALGVCSTFARIGSIIAPYIVMLSQLPGLSVTLPMVIFGVLAVAAGLMILRLPETLNSNMCQTIEETNRTEEYYGFMWMGKRVDNPCKCERLSCLALSPTVGATLNGQNAYDEFHFGRDSSRFSCSELTPMVSFWPDGDESHVGEGAVENAPLISSN